MKMQNINISYEYLIHVNCRNDGYAMIYCVPKNKYAEVWGSHPLKNIHSVSIFQFSEIHTSKHYSSKTCLDEHLFIVSSYSCIMQLQMLSLMFIYPLSL